MDEIIATLLATEPKRDLAAEIAAAKATRLAEQGRAKKAASTSAVGLHPKVVANMKKIARKAAKPIKKAAAPKAKKSSESGACSICGKPLSRHTSVTNGMGDTCANKVKMLPKGMTMEDHYESIWMDDLPEGWIKLADAITKAKAKGYTGHRFIQAVGGDRMLRKPINKFFTVKFYKGARYISKDCLAHLKDLEKI